MHPAKGLALAAILFLLAAPPSAAQSPISIGVSPPRLNFEVGPDTRTQALRVYNFGGEPAEVTVSLHDWTLDEQNNVRLIEPTEQSLDQWMIVTPTRFVVPANDSQTVRFAVRPKVQPEPGEHRAIIYFEQRPSGQEHDAVRVVGRVGVAVYGYVGEIQRVGALRSVVVEPGGAHPHVAFEIESRGTAHVRMSGQYAIWNAERYPGAQATAELADLEPGSHDLPSGVVDAGLLPSLPVLPATQRKLALTLPPDLTPGQYVLDLNGELSGVPVDRGIPFVVGAGSVAREGTD